MKVNPAVTHDRQRRVLDLLIELYGDDSNAIVNALHEIATRVALTCGIAPDDYAAGVKHHWDHLANILNDHAESSRH